MKKSNFPTFGLSNFKSYKDLQEIEIAPITLLYGQNSGGKSSLLESLLCTAQSMIRNEIEKGEFSLSGTLSNSGTYASVRNKFNSEEYIFLKFKPKLYNSSEEINEGDFYLSKAESLISPEIILYLKNKGKNKSSSILFVEKIEILYGDFLKGLNLIFESTGKEEFVLFTQGKRDSRIPNKSDRYSKYRLKRESFKNLKKISELSIKFISDEIKSFLKAFNDKKFCNLVIPVQESSIGGNVFFPRRELGGLLNILKFASLNSGAWIIQNRSGFTLINLGFKNNNKLINKKFHDLFKDHLNILREEYFSFIEKRKIEISLFISSSKDPKRESDNARIQIIYIFDKKGIDEKIVASNQKKYEDFYENIENHFKYILKDLPEFQENLLIKEKFKVVNTNYIDTKIKLKVLLDCFTSFKKFNIDIQKNKDEYIENLKDSINILKNELDNLINGYRGFYEIFEKYNSELTFKSIESEYFMVDIPILPGEFESFISNGFKEFLNEYYLNKKDFFDDTKIDDLISNLNRIIRRLEKINLRIFFDLKIIKLHNLFRGNRINLAKEKISFEGFYELIDWFKNDFTFQREYLWKENIKDNNSANQFTFNYINKEYSAIPFLPLNLIPLQLSSKLVHLGPARPGGKRFYDIETINKLSNSDVGYLLKIKYKLQLEHLINNISKQLKQSKIANGIDIRTIKNPNHDLREIIIYPFNEIEAKNYIDENIAVNIVDTGYGISQILPILINAHLDDSNTIIIQQPETHIHPRLQAEIGSIITKSLSKSLISFKKNWILETHSETILLRLLKEIRKGNLNHEFLRVYYIDKNSEGNSIIKKMQISQEGQLISKWPDGFFSTDLNEMFD